MAKKKENDGMSVGYKRAKGNFKKLETPFDKSDRLRREWEDLQKKQMLAWEEYMAYSDKFESHFEKYKKARNKVGTYIATFDDELDFIGLDLFPTDNKKDSDFPF